MQISLKAEFRNFYHRYEVGLFVLRLILLLFSFVVLLHGVLKARLSQQDSLVSGGLVGVVDLRNIELLNDLGVYVYLFHLENGYDSLTQVDRDDVV